MKKYEDKIKIHSLFHSESKNKCVKNIKLKAAVKSCAKNGWLTEVNWRLLSEFVKITKLDAQFRGNIFQVL